MGNCVYYCVQGGGDRLDGNAFNGPGQSAGERAAKSLGGQGDVLPE